MCWVCDRLENLIAGWNEEREFQEQTSSDDYHRGLSKGFSECVKDLSGGCSINAAERAVWKIPRVRWSFRRQTAMGYFKRYIETER